VAIRFALPPWSGSCGGGLRCAFEGSLAWTLGGESSCGVLGVGDLPSGWGMRCGMRVGLLASCAAIIL